MNSDLRIVCISFSSKLKCPKLQTGLGGEIPYTFSSQTNVSNRSRREILECRDHLYVQLVPQIVHLLLAQLGDVFVLLIKVLLELVILDLSVINGRKWFDDFLFLGHHQIAVVIIVRILVVLVVIGVEAGVRVFLKPPKVRFLFVLFLYVLACTPFAFEASIPFSHPIKSGWLTRSLPATSSLFLFFLFPRFGQVVLSLFLKSPNSSAIGHTGKQIGHQPRSQP